MQKPPEALHNHLLAAFPKAALKPLLPHMEQISFSAGHILHEADAPIHTLYFPIDTIVSQLYIMENGSTAEIALIGNEGMIGLSRLLDGQPAVCQAVVISPGQFYQISSKHFEQQCRQHPDMMRLMLRYTQALLGQMAQTAACNRHHSILQQLCRWLLLSLDCMPGNELSMTQELIAGMLGVRREGVTDAAGKLRNLGVIEYQRGHITLLDRAQLEQLCCECYQVVKRRTERMMH